MSNEYNQEQYPFEEVTIRSKTAECFLRELDETHDRWDDGRLWIYRGQNDARWPLTPSLYRNWHEDRTADYELNLIHNFIQNANMANLPIPSNALGYFSYAKKGKGVITQTAVADGLEEARVYDFTNVVFAIAQHSGIPTRLLDFTYDPLVAAYFASNLERLYKDLRISHDQKAEYFSDILSRYHDSPSESHAILQPYVQMFLEIRKLLPNEIAVWAIGVMDLHALTTLRMLDHPYSEISNLRAQMGIFVCDTAHFAITEESIWGFTRELLKLVDSGGIYRLTLPVSELDDLHELLKKKRYFPALMTPSYELIAKVVMELADKRERAQRESSPNKRE